MIIQLKYLFIPATVKALSPQLSPGKTYAFLCQLFSHKKQSIQSITEI